jgi:hypothetical protein
MTKVPATSRLAEKLARRDTLGLPDIARLIGLPDVEARQMLDALGLRVPCSPHDLVSSVRRCGSTPFDIPRAFVVSVDRAAAVKRQPQEDGFLASTAPLELDDEAAITLLVDSAGNGNTDAAWMLVDLAIAHFQAQEAARKSPRALLGMALFSKLRDIQTRACNSGRAVEKIRALAPALAEIGVRRGRGRQNEAADDPWQGVCELHASLHASSALEGWIAGCTGKLIELHNAAATNLDDALLPLGLVAGGGRPKSDEMQALKLLAMEEKLRRAGQSADKARAEISARLGIKADQILKESRRAPKYRQAVLMLSPNRRKGVSLNDPAIQLAQQGIDVPDGEELDDLLSGLAADDNTTL